MKPILRTYAGIVLTLMLVLTSQSMAVARGMPNATGEIILCTSEGIVSVAVDENGQPVDPPHICPDCAMSLFAFVAETSPFPVRPLGSVETLIPTKVIHQASAQEVPAAARGPPVFS
ncbi:hypothetical protein RXV86_21010 [Alisedimentitalea sp. MJ-SS2]|uniref:hypothetical protein n=1 Tax=Aliisedimentitalea sp. MJ-SS2 TaxID=3049795 RepID=UPI002914B3E5|nr:hypothetical protein [Alisedimentitalea sp. MJ-SS2]MDU8929874.1 hypothetical protein [Alisedimentitalea sp. MJ-SS2]